MLKTANLGNKAGNTGVFVLEYQQENQIMKRQAPYLLSGLFGGLFVLAGFLIYNQFSQNEKVVIVEESPGRLARPVNYSSNASAVVDFSLAAEQASPSVVLIKAQESQYRAQERLRRQRAYNPFSRFFDFDDYNYGVRQGSGSGVIISEEGYIVTNNHVIDFADKFIVTLHDGREYSGFLVGTSPDSDLAVLKIEADDISPIAIGSSEKAKVGEWVLAIGNPFELTNTATAGIISAKGRDLNLQQGGEGISAFIQTDAAVNSGNSGGALVNLQGELIGINTAIFTRNGGYVGYSFAIPAEIMNSTVQDIIANGNSSAPSSKGYMGVTIANVDSEVRDMLGFKVNQGVYIYQMRRGGAAARSGIQPNDVIIGVNNNRVSNVDELQALLEDARAGEEIQLTIDRYGDRKNIPVVLEAG